MKKLLKVLLVLAAFFGAVPALAYWMGMQNMDATPALPSGLSYSESEAAQIWEDRGEALPIEMAAITPWHFYHLIWCSRNGNVMEDFLTCGDQYPGLQAAAYAGEHYMLEHIKQNGVLWRYLSRTALTIWITRHWTADELTAELIRLEALP